MQKQFLVIPYFCKEMITNKITYENILLSLFFPLTWTQWVHMLIFFEDNIYVLHAEEIMLQLRKLEMRSKTYKIKFTCKSV